MSFDFQPNVCSLGLFWGLRVGSLLRSAIEQRLVSRGNFALDVDVYERLQTSVHVQQYSARHPYLSNFCHVIRLIVELLDDAIEPRRNLAMVNGSAVKNAYQPYLYRCFVRLYFANGIELLDTRSWLDKPLDDLAFGDACTISLELATQHAPTHLPRYLQAGTA